MRALIVASFLLVAVPALAQTGTPSGAASSGPATGQNSRTSTTTSNPAIDPAARSYVNPQSTEAPKNDDNHNSNYQTPAGSQASQPGNENSSGAQGVDRKAR
jgi:hypothetical protein